MLHGKEPAPCRNRGPCSMGWPESFLDTLKENVVRLVTYVPDKLLTPLIKGVNADSYFISVGTTREDEAIGMMAGSWMAGLRGCVMMQTSGFGTSTAPSPTGGRPCWRRRSTTSRASRRPCATRR